MARWFLQWKLAKVLMAARRPVRQASHECAFIGFEPESISIPDPRAKHNQGWVTPTSWAYLGVDRALFHFSDLQSGRNMHYYFTHRSKRRPPEAERLVEKAKDWLLGTGIWHGAAYQVSSRTTSVVLSRKWLHGCASRVTGARPQTSNVWAPYQLIVFLAED